MDERSRETLIELMTTQRVAALGTLRGGAPEVTMVQIAPAADFSAFYIHISGLAHHTRNLNQDSRASLMIMEDTSARPDPQTLARISISGTAERIDKNSEAFEVARSLYVSKHPDAARNFMLADFDLFAIKPESARFVAGFGRIFDLNSDDLRRVAADS